MKKIPFIHFVMFCFCMGFSLHLFSEDPSKPQDKNLHRVILYDFPIQGYALKAENSDPMDWDEAGKISLRQVKLNMVDIFLELRYGNYEFRDVPIQVEIYEDTNGNRIYDLELSDPREGFFSNILIGRDKTFIDLACDGGDAQLCYQNLVSRGFDTTEVLKQSEMKAITQRKVKWAKVVHLLSGAYDGIDDRGDSGFIEMKEKVLNHLRNGVKVYHINPQITERGRLFPDNRTGNFGNAQTASQMYSVPRYRYGIVFEGYECEHAEITFPESLAKDWEGTDIDIGIYRSLPSKAQIKSDLSYYNKYWYCYSTGRGFENHIIAYCPYVNGIHPGMNPNICPTSWKTGEDQWLEPDEVKSLWWDGLKYEKYYGWTKNSVYPKGMIILCLACYGYSMKIDSEPFMAKAFVNVYDSKGNYMGAKSFMGAAGVPIPSIKMWQPPQSDPDFNPDKPFQPWDNDVFVRPFWLSMIVGEYSVEEAAALFISTHNYYGKYTYQEPIWDLGQIIKIMGDAKAKLPPYY